VIIYSWHSPNKESYITKFINVNKDTIITLIENIKLITVINKRFSYNKYTNTEKNKGWYRVMLDHILIPEGSYRRIIKAKYLENTIILSDYLASQLGYQGANSTPKKVDLPGPMTQVACGHQHTMVILEDGSMYVWGCNTEGQLGLGDFSNRFSVLKNNSIPGTLYHLICGSCHSAALTMEPSTFGGTTAATTSAMGPPCPSISPSASLPRGSGK
jgi:hypothetical protein